MAKHRFGTPRPHQAQGSRLKAVRPPSFKGSPYEPVPVIVGNAPYEFDLATVIDPALIARMNRAKKMVFHIVGDTGGIKHPAYQQSVANAMEADALQGAPDAPAFFYHLGDVVYYNGESAQYFPQFYEPYDHYPLPIVAIPGNHDGDPLPGGNETTLQAFLANFCTATPTTSPNSGGTVRTTMTEPNPYFTLTTPMATFIGLYTNVPEGGEVDANQQAWLVAELKKADSNKMLVLAMHHPIYSLDVYHTGSQKMHTLYTEATVAAKRTPDIVFAAHVHNYQRFTQTNGADMIPFIVNGGGGYWNLHHMEKINGQMIIPPYVVDAEVTLEAFNDDHHGFMRVQVEGDVMTGWYFAAPQPTDTAGAPPTLQDYFQYNWRTHTYVKR